MSATTRILWLCDPENQVCWYRLAKNPENLRQRRGTAESEGDGRLSMSQRLLWQFLFQENRSHAQLSLGEVRIMLHRRVEVLLSLVGLSVLSAHFSQRIRSIGIVGMRY